MRIYARRDDTGTTPKEWRIELLCIQNIFGGVFQDTYCVLKSYGHGLVYWLDEQIMPYLDVARYGSVALIHVFKFKANLISTLVERWRPETLTFHLPFGKCTITLENVAL
ncbi:hypothetical protein J1N35_034141 [Gossypium stocksii]|uniref:Aminotransferase-like plant mobile domain-containing protein n=1 Tax=Gossypium stocksii TaxID=47602 RepID=A0A9D3ZNZ9_9ROSI|nr:hypothetical protein J1N35_034141 [Gossypium stocksii]